LGQIIVLFNLKNSFARIFIEMLLPIFFVWEFASIYIKAQWWTLTLYQLQNGYPHDIVVNQINVGCPQKNK